MSQQIKSITFKGELEVWGIYNYNGSGNKKNDKNHMYAKILKINTGKIKAKNKDGKIEEKDTFKKIDYTSSRCLRHEIFKDLQPNQPVNKVFKDQFIKMVASEIGLLRGYLSTDDRLKRCSPLHIADARTIGNIDIVYDQGSNSKPTEKYEGEKNRKGEDKKNITMFSKDNIPYRKQELQGGINLKELQFLSLFDKDSDFSMISEKDKDEFLKLLQGYFKKHNVDNHCEVKEYIDINAVYENKRQGILLNQEQIRHLVKVVFQRIRMINGLKAGARLTYQKNSLKVSFFDENECLNIDESKLIDKLKGIDFYHFFKEA